MVIRLLSCVGVCGMVFLAGCTSEAAKKAMSKPIGTDQYAGFDSNDANGSKRTAEMPKPVSDAQDPE